MKDDNRDRKNVYEPMWRAIKTFGLPRDYFHIICVVVPPIWGFTQSLFLSLGLLIILYAYGYFKSQKDPEFMLIQLVRMYKIKGKNMKLGNQYGSGYIP